MLDYFYIQFGLSLSIKMFKLLHDLMFLLHTTTVFKMRLRINKIGIYYNGYKQTLNDNNIMVSTRLVCLKYCEYSSVKCAH